MAGYSTSVPPKLLVPSFGGDGGPSIWTYESVDAATVVDGAGYFTNAKALGMRAGDIVLVTDTDASPPALTSHRVVTIAANGSADLSEGVALSGATGD